jgi:hypothetical protein
MQYSSSKVLNEVFLLINRSKQDQRSDLQKKKYLQIITQLATTTLHKVETIMKRSSKFTGSNLIGLIG